MHKKRSDIAKEWLKQAFTVQHDTDPTVQVTAKASGDDFDINGTLSSVTGSAGDVSRQNPAASNTTQQYKQLPFLFTEETWNCLQSIGRSIGTTEPSQIVRRALAVLWLVTFGDCSIKNNLTGKTVRIPE